MRLGEVARYDAPQIERLGLPDAVGDLPFVLVTPNVLSEMYEHAQEGLPLEIAGYALGRPLVDSVSERPCTSIQHVVRAECISTRTHVTLLPSGLHKVQETCQHTGTILVGYYHSHPGFSVFQSGEDLKTFREYYPEPYQIAIVVDPTQAHESQLNPVGSWIGYFGWDTDKAAQRLPGEHVRLPDGIEGVIDPVSGPTPSPVIKPGNDKEKTSWVAATEDQESQPSNTFSVAIDIELGKRAWKRTLRGNLPKFSPREKKDRA